MKALTFHQPWLWSILWAGKRIENRSNKRGRPPLCSHRGPLYLHASRNHPPAAQFKAAALKIRDVSGLECPPREWDYAYGGDISNGVCDSEYAVPGTFNDPWVTEAPLGGLGRWVSSGLRVRHSSQLWAGHIVGVAEVGGEIEPWSCSACGGSTGSWRHCRACEGTMKDDGSMGDLRWWFGGHALILNDVRPIIPVPCKGARQLWEVPADVAARIAENER